MNQKEIDILNKDLENIYKITRGVKIESLKSFISSIIPKYLEQQNLDIIHNKGKDPYLKSK